MGLEKQHKNKKKKKIKNKIDYAVVKPIFLYLFPLSFFFFGVGIKHVLNLWVQKSSL